MKWMIFFIVLALLFVIPFLFNALRDRFILGNKFYGDKVNKEKRGYTERDKAEAKSSLYTTGKTYFTGSGGEPPSGSGD